MPSTHLSLHFHIVFSTKERRRLIEPEWRPRLHAFLGGAIRRVGGVAEAVGGVDDHAHVLAGLRATHRLADVLREIKHASSQWVHEELRERRFQWQVGFGAFTVSPSQLDNVRRYIARQDEHHKNVTFEDEFERLLRLSGVEFDPLQLWRD